MINNPKIMEEILEKIKNIPDEVILKAMEKVKQEVDEWYDSELNKCTDRFARKEVDK